MEARTKLINHIRSTVKVHGSSRHAGPTLSLARWPLSCPKRSSPVLSSLLGVIGDLTKRIRAYDRRIEELCGRYEETEQLRQCLEWDL